MFICFIFLQEFMNEFQDNEFSSFCVPPPFSIAMITTWSVRDHFALMLHYSQRRVLHASNPAQASFKSSGALGVSLPTEWTIHLCFVRMIVPQLYFFPLRASQTRWITWIIATGRVLYQKAWTFFIIISGLMCCFLPPFMCLFLIRIFKT